MFNRIMFVIVLALFALCPLSLVYANNQIPDQTQPATLDLGNYKIVPAPPKLWMIINSEAWNSTAGSWHATANGACAAFYSVAAGYYAREGNKREKLTGYTVQLATTSGSSDRCLLKRSVEYKKADGTYDKPELDNMTYFLQSKDNPASCPETSTPKYLGWYVNRVTSTPPTGACWASCEHVYKPAGLSSPPRAEPNNHKAGISLLVLPDATTNGKSCDLNLCSPDNPECGKPDPPPEDCTAAQKTANGGTCPKPDADGNKCNESEKAGNGGKCQTPDPNGTKCPTAQKTGAGGTCSATGNGNGSGDGQCTPEQKAANGGTCPAGAGGTCTSNPVNKKFCDLADWLKGGDDFKVPDTKPVPITDDMPSSIPIDQIESNRVIFASSCPPDVVVPISVGSSSGNVRLKFDPICDFARLLRPFIIAMAYLSGAYIVLGLSKD